MKERTLNDLKNYAERLANNIFAKKVTNEQLSMAFVGELTLYQRFNQAKIRQSTFVTQFEVSTYADRIWQDQEFDNYVNKSVSTLELLNIPARKVPRCKYRTYLTPTATHELVSTLCGWGGLSQRAHEEGNCPLSSFLEGKHSLSSHISLTEDFSLGLTPAFNDRGELSKEKKSLILNGKLQSLLVSSETKKRYGKEKKWESNSADDSEMPRSLNLHTGTIAQEDILKKLDTGLLLSNLWYINLSNLQTARMTGMTRYACFWVENGKIVSPIEHMRFDESMYSVIGSELEAVGQENAIITDTQSYDRRSVGGSCYSGLLLKNFTFTL